MRSYLIIFAAFIALLAGLIMFLGGWMFASKVDSVTWGLYLYFVLITLLFHVGLVHYSKDRPQVFVRYYMGTTTAKLLLHMLFIVLYSFFNSADAVRFIITFLIFYVLFTTFEVSVVWKQFRKK